MAPHQQPSLLAQQHGGTCFCRSGHDSQGTAARWHALMLGATLTRATHNGRVCFHRARASSARGHNSMAACASTWRHVNSQSAAARGHSLLQSATTTRAQQHCGVRFYRAGVMERQNEAGKLGRLRGGGQKEAAKRRRTGACCCTLAEALRTVEGGQREAPRGGQGAASATLRHSTTARPSAPPQSATAARPLRDSNRAPQQPAAS
jgi:hypothetical protein